MAETIAEEFSRRLVKYRAGEIDQATLNAASTAIIDTVAVTLLGSAADCSRIARDTLIQTSSGNSSTAANGPCLVYGTGWYTNALDAAFLNGIASHADDYDDFTDLFGGHPSVPVVPAVLALAEMNGNSGKQVLAAYVAGVELENRLAMGVHFHHYEKGWHPTSTLGVFGAAAACAQLLDLDFERTVHALSIAASHASGLKANFGSMTKPLHVGHCARSGLQAALLAGNGFTGRADVFEHHQGYLEVYNGAGNYDKNQMLGEWFNPAIALSPGLSIKQFPCCGSTHQAVYMALQLMREHEFNIETITNIDLKVSAKRLPHTNNPDPRSGLQAKFSMHYILARALVSGPLRLAHFEGGAWNDPKARSLMDLMSVNPDEKLGQQESNNPFGADLSLTLTDQRVLNARTEHLAGRGKDFPMSEKELWEKFADCAQVVMSPDSARTLFKGLRELSNTESIIEFTSTMARTTVPTDSAASI